MEEQLTRLEHGAVPAAEEGVLDDIQKYSRETSSSGEGAEAPAAKQSIIEVPNGQSIDGQPQQPGPQYKRGRGRSFFKDAPRKGVSCQVPGCDRSLHKLRDYYKRYKICPYHLELNCMVVEGQSIRFCQQCGRFQLLDEFDGDRRSCRRKLEKHNERRRKLEGSITDSDSGGEGSGRSRSGLKYHRSGSPSRPWGIPLPGGAPNGGLDVSQMLQNMARDEYLMKGFGPSLAEGVQSLASVQWMPSSTTGGGIAGSNSNGVSGGGAPSHMHPDLVAVLAEVAAANTIGGMSSHPHQQQQQQQEQQSIPVLTSEPAHPNAVRASPANGRPGVTAEALQQFLRETGGSGMGMSNGTSVTAPTNGINPTTAGGGVPFVKSEPMSLGAAGSAFAWPLNGAPPMGASTQSTDAVSDLPMKMTGNGNGTARRVDNSRVAALAAAAAAASADEQQRWGGGSQQEQQTQQLGDMLRTFQSQVSHNNNNTRVGSAVSGPAPPSTLHTAANLNNNNSNNSGNGNGRQAPGPFHPSAPAFLAGALGGTPQAPVVGQLLNLLRQLENANSVRAPPEQDVMTLSLKLFKMTPAQLPPGLLHELTAWMTKTPTYGEIAMRPGCVHLTTSILSTECERACLDMSVCGTVRRALSSTGLGFGGPAAEAVLLQMQRADGPKAAIVLNGVLKMVLDLAATDAAHRPPVPSLFSVRPLAALPDYSGSFLVLGQGMDSNQNDRIFCRTHGRNAQVEVINRGPALLDANNCDASTTGGGWLQVAVPQLGVGCYAMEIARGPFVSSPVGFVVLEDPIAVAEVRQLEIDADGIADVPGFIQKLGIIAQMRRRVDTGVTLRTEMQDETVIRIAQVAQEIAAVSLKKGWPAVLSLALPVISATMPPAQGLDCVSQLLGTGVTPLSAAVVSGNADIIEVLGAWATVHDISLMSAEETVSTLGLTALHLAAMLNEPCSVASALNKWVHGASEAWSSIPPAAGVSALSIAASLEQDDLLQMLVLQGVPAAEEVLASMYKARDLMCASPDKAIEQIQFKDDTDVKDNCTDLITPRRNGYGVSAYGDDDGASSSNTSSVRSSRAGSPGEDYLSRAQSLVTLLSPNAVEAAPGSNASIPASEAVGGSTNARSRGGRLLRRRARRSSYATDSTASSSSSSGTSFLRSLFSRSFSYNLFLFIHMLVVTVLLPALLPERIALGAAVLPAVVVASFSGVDQNAGEMAWSMFCAALMTLMAVNLNKSGTMAHVRAKAYAVLIASPRIRAGLSTLWLLSATKTLHLNRLQNAVLILMNTTLCLIPLPAVNSGKEAWLKMTGAAMLALVLVVCVPMRVSKWLGHRSDESAAITTPIDAAATAVQERPLQQQQRPPLEEFKVQGSSA